MFFFIGQMMAKFKSYEQLRADAMISVTPTDSQNEFSDLVVRSGNEVIGVLRRDDSPEAVQVVFQTLLDKTLNTAKSNLEQRLEAVESEFVKNLIPEVQKREKIIADRAYSLGRKSKRIFGLF